MPPTVQPALFDLEVEPSGEPTGALTPEYRHEVIVDGCVHPIISIDPWVDDSTVRLAEWSHRMRCGGAS